MMASVGKVTSDREVKKVEDLRVLSDREVKKVEELENFTVLTVKKACPVVALSPKVETMAVQMTLR